MFEPCDDVMNNLYPRMDRFFNQKSMKNIDNHKIKLYNNRFTVKFGVCWRSSTVEQLICNQQVMGSNPFASCLSDFFCSGGVPEWPKGADCKSVGSAFGGSNPPPSTLNRFGGLCGRSSVVEPQPSKLITWVRSPSPAPYRFQVENPENRFCPRSSVGRARPW